MDLSASLLDSKHLIGILHASDVSTNVLLQNDQADVELSSVIQANLTDDISSAYDICIVFPVASETSSFTSKGEEYIEKLKQLGFELYAFLGIKKTEIFVLLRVP